MSGPHFSARQFLADCVDCLLATGKSTPLADWIEYGGDLSDIGPHEREVLARLVRTGKPLKRGQKRRDFAKRGRNYIIRCRIAQLAGYGLPVNSDSALPIKVLGIEGLATDAVGVASDYFELGREQIYQVWLGREPEDPNLAYWFDVGQKAKDRGLAI